MWVLTCHFFQPQRKLVDDKFIVILVDLGPENVFKRNPYLSFYRNFPLFEVIQIVGWINRFKKRTVTYFTLFFIELGSCL